MVQLYPQYVYCINHDYKIDVDHILKYESLDSDFLEFIKIYKDNVYNFMKANIYNNINIVNTYDIPKKYPDLAEKIYQIYKKDFEYFDYDK